MLKINKKQIKTTTKQKVFLILFGILLALIILELGLRIGGFVISSYQRSSNEEDFDADYRILCLGESTTADLHGNKNSWPAQLEIILNNKSSETRFKVFNEGVGGTNTAFILSHLEDNLDKYKPGMVITMMGINDKELYIKYEETLRVKIVLLFEDLRIHKLSKLLLAAWNNKIKGSTIKNTGLANESKLINEKVREYIKLAAFYQGEGKFKQAEEILDKAIELNPNNYETYIGLGRIYFDEGKFKQAEEMWSKSIEMNPNNEEVYTRLTHIYHEQGVSNKEIEKFYKKNGFSFKIIEDTTNDNIIKYHYQQLYKELNKRKIKYIAMQYPTLNINELKDMFEGDEDIILVSNKVNFKKALLEDDYWDYFSDSFAGDFGHCTLRGNRLISENLANVILEELDID